MHFRAEKIAGCCWVAGPKRYDTALIQLTTTKGEFFRFVLYVRTTHSLAEGIDDTFCSIDLKEKETDREKVVERYFSPGGGVTKNFPRIKSDRWQETDSWLAQVVEDVPGTSPRSVRRRISLSRPKPGKRFWSGHLRKHKWEV
jgi:hypothetical protein